MKTPKFWESKGFYAEIAGPASVFYYLFMRIRSNYLTKKYTPKKFDIPIICVGNATAGGAGKTPVAIAIAKLLLEKGKKPTFISRGYKGKLKGPVKVDIESHKVTEVGDEPLLLARTAPCWVGKNRADVIKAAIEDKAEILILDDGLQDILIEKDLSFMVIDGGYGFGNGFLLPAGPLRDRLDKVVAMADAVIMVGNDDHDVGKQVGELPIINASIVAAEIEDKESDYVAFAGIGRPEKFFNTLRGMGINLVETLEFADHHKYKEKDIIKIIEVEKDKKAKLITTEKDAMRLPQDIKDKVTILPIEISWQNKDEIYEKISLSA